MFCIIFACIKKMENVLANSRSGRPPLSFIWPGAAGIVVLDVQEEQRKRADTILDGAGPSGLHHGRPDSLLHTSSITTHHGTFNSRVKSIDHNRGTPAAIQRPAGLPPTPGYKSHGGRAPSSHLQLRFKVSP